MVFGDKICWSINSESGVNAEMKYDKKIYRSKETEVK